MPHLHNGNPRQKVQILAPLAVPQTRALAAHKHNRLTRIRAKHILAVGLHDVRGVHFGRMQ